MYICISEKYTDMNKARYNRVSSQGQKLDRQLNKAESSEIVFNDIISGSIPFSERPQAKELIKKIEAKQINYVSVSSIDRLGRNTIDILETIELFTIKGVTLKVDNLGIESLTNGKKNNVFNLIISVMSNVSEMEREAILERQREGIALAVAKGTYKGRLKGSNENNKEFLSKYKPVIKELKNSNLSLRKVARLHGVSLGTIQKIKKAM